MWRLGRIAVGFYAWAVTTAFGAALIDVVYARDASDGSTLIRAEASDVLLAIAALTVLAAAGAIAATWDRGRARTYVVASFAVVIAGLLTPTLLGAAVGPAEHGSLGVGPWLRLGEAGLASLLAFIGLWEAWRRW